MRLDESNRTEKFWTATVLPALLAQQNFVGISVLLDLIGNEKHTVPFDEHPSGKKQMIPLNELCPAKWNYDNLQLSTELWYARDFSKNKEFAVPDVVLRLCEKYLIVIEAKFFQRLKETAIKDQLGAQRKTIEDILKTQKDIKYVHHCFLHGGADKVSNVNADSIITWKEIFEAFRDQNTLSNTDSSNDDYFLQILQNALERYDKEFPPTKNPEYFVDQVDFIDLIGLLHKHGEDSSVGLGVGSPKTAEETLAELVSAIREEMSILKNLSNEGGEFKMRPAFLREKGYKGQSAIEYLFIHSSQKYKVDYTDGSGDDKSKNKKWVDGARFLNTLKQLTTP